MRTKRHWEECKNLASYHAAQSFKWQLSEVAKTMGFDPHGIKVLPKKDVDELGSIADSQVMWEEGPMDWTTRLEHINTPPGVCIEIEDGCTISFYDI